MEPSLSQRRKSLVAVLEFNILQPSCGCKVAWQWGFMAASDVLPGTLRIGRITPCKKHEADQATQDRLAREYHQRPWTRREEARMREKPS